MGKATIDVVPEGPTMIFGPKKSHFMVQSQEGKCRLVSHLLPSSGGEWVCLAWGQFFLDTIPRIIAVLPRHRVESRSAWH